MPKKQLRWRKQPNNSGLAAIGQAPRGAILSYGTERVGSVSGLRTKEGEIRYYWVAGWGRSEVPHRNTSSEALHFHLQGAKDACKAYVVEHLKRDD